MLKFAANISMMYNEFEFMDRFGAAAKDGFKAIEFLFPYAYSAQEMASQLRTHQLRQVLFNSPPGDLTQGEKGMACIPGREAEFQAGMLSAFEYAKVLDCRQIHLMAGFKPAGVDIEQLTATFQKNVQWAAQAAQPLGIDLLLEPINTRDMPNYFLNYQQQAHSIIQSIGASNVKVQMDFYHCQIMEGDVARKLQLYLPTGRVSHLQIAGVPQRFEPDIGELNYPYLFSVIADLGFEGYVACEYRPRRGTAANSTTDGLGWLRNFTQIQLIEANKLV